MKNNIIDANSPDENVESAEYLASEETVDSDNPDSVSFINTKDNTVNRNQATDSQSKKEKVAEKVEGDDTSNPDPHDHGEEEAAISYSGPESWVREWESDHRQLLAPQPRKLALLAASIHLGEGRGLLVSDLIKLGLGKDNARKKMYDSMANGLFAPDKIRIGHEKQYFLSNYKYAVDTKRRSKEQYTDDSLIHKDLILQLLIALSNKKYTYHNIRLETSLNYLEEYNLFKWNIPSRFNKQKVASFKLGPWRKCTITLSTTGTIGISIECTLDPYPFHTPYGIAEFFGSCGQIFSFLQREAKGALNVVPSISEWFLLRFEYNKDINKCDEEITVLSWAPAGGRIELEYLGTIFQIYPKVLPYLEDCLRLEGKFSTKAKKKMVDMIGDVVSSTNSNPSPEPPFISAEELLRKAKENLESESPKSI